MDSKYSQNLIKDTIVSNADDIEDAALTDEELYATVQKHPKILENAPDVVVHSGSTDMSAVDAVTGDPVSISREFYIIYIS